MEISFVVYGEPVAKGRPRFARMGKFVRAYTPKETEVAENNFRAQSLKYKPETPLAGPLEISIKVYRSIPRSLSQKRQELAERGVIRPTTRPDGDNYLKLCCDALNGIYWHDDAQIIDMRVQKFFSERPRIEVRVSTDDTEKHIAKAEGQEYLCEI